MAVALIAGLIGLAVVAAAGVGVVATGGLDFIINPNEKPLLNGTIFNEDNKTYTILVQEGTLVPKNETKPEPPNKGPIIIAKTPITAQVNKPVTLEANIDDPDGNITDIIWNQESGEIVNFVYNESKIHFTPEINGNLCVFSRSNR